MVKYGIIIVLLMALTAALLIPISESDIEVPISAVDISSAIALEKADNTDLSKGNEEIPDEITSECPSVGEVVFPHREHYEDFEIECVECHHEMDAKNIDIPHEEYFNDFWIDCKVCHDKPESEEMIAHTCSSCHNSKPINIADEMISKKVAIHKNCWGCHESGTSVEASESCVTCHVK